MNKSLQKELLRLDRVGFRELEISIGIARNLRTAMAEYNLSDEFVRGRLKIEQSSLDQYKVGAFPFTLADISGMDAMIAEQEIKRIKSKSMLQVGEGKE